MEVFQSNKRSSDIVIDYYGTQLTMSDIDSLELIKKILDVLTYKPYNYLEELFIEDGLAEETLHNINYLINTL